MAPPLVRVTKVCQATQFVKRGWKRFVADHTLLSHVFNLFFDNLCCHELFTYQGFQFRQCLEFLDEMTEMGIPKNVIIFGAAMSCMEKCSRADIGFQLMKRMKEEGIAPNVHIYNSAISACARSNLWEKGYELYEEMDREGVKRDVVTFNAGKPNLGEFFIALVSTSHICTHCRCNGWTMIENSVGCRVFANSTRAEIVRSRSRTWVLRKSVSFRRTVV